MRSVRRRSIFFRSSSFSVSSLLASSEMTPAEDDSSKPSGRECIESSNVSRAASDSAAGVVLKENSLSKPKENSLRNRHQPRRNNGIS